MSSDDIQSQPLPEETGVDGSSSDLEARIIRFRRRRHEPPLEFPLPPPLPGTPEARRLGRHSSLTRALKPLPRSWLDTLAARHHVEGTRRRDLIIAELAERLASVACVRKALAHLPHQSRLRLAHLLATGGWCLQSRYARHFPSDLPFLEWDWTRDLPRSPLGRLRAVGFVFLGQAQDHGKPVAIIMVPHEVREALAVIPWHEVPFTGDRGGTSNNGESDLAAPNGKFYPGLEWPSSSRGVPPRQTPLSLTSFREGATLSRFLRDSLRAVAKERLALAEHLLAKAAELYPHRAEPHVQLGLLALRQESLGRARRHLEKGLHLAAHQMLEEPSAALDLPGPPPLVTAYHGLARVALAEGRLDEAARVFERLLELDPQDIFEVRFLLPETIQRMDEPGRAESYYVAALDDSRADVWFGLGLAQAEQGKLEEASLAWRKAMLLNLYVAPLLLGRPAFRRRIAHASPAEEPEAAGEYVERTRDLWESQPEALALLRILWHSPSATLERTAAIELAARELREKNGEKRLALKAERRRLATLESLHANHPQVLVELGLRT
ncbi:MAG: tetratricopeptide repeat protein [Planctomycetota bacterium]